MKIASKKRIEAVTLRDPDRPGLDNVMFNCNRACATDGKVLAFVRCEREPGDTSRYVSGTLLRKLRPLARQKAIRKKPRLGYWWRHDMARRIQQPVTVESEPHLRLKLKPRHVVTASGVAYPKEPDSATKFPAEDRIATVVESAKGRPHLVVALNLDLLNRAASALGSNIVTLAFPNRPDPEGQNDGPIVVRADDGEEDEFAIVMPRRGTPDAIRKALKEVA